MSYIIVMNKSYRDNTAIRNVINYMIQGTSDNCKNFMTNRDCIYYGVNPLSLQTIINSFEFDQKIYNKDFGIKIHHFVLSIYKENYLNIKNKKTWARLLSDDISCYLREKGFKNIACIHTADNGNVHIHFAVNSVNSFTGNKLTNTQSFYNDLLYFLKSNYHILKWEGVSYR